MVGCICEYGPISVGPKFYMDGKVGDEIVRISKISEVSLSELCLSYLEQFYDGMVRIE